MKNVLGCLKLKCVGRERFFFFLSNGRSYTGICRHRCNEGLKGGGVSAAGEHDCSKRKFCCILFIGDETNTTQPRPL